MSEGIGAPNDKPALRILGAVSEVYPREADL